MGGLTGRRVSGARVNQLSLSLSPGRVLAADMDCRGKEESLISPTTPSYQDDEPLHLNGFTAEVGGAANVDVEEFLVRFDNGLVDSIYTAGGGGKLTRLPAGRFAVGGRLTMTMETTEAQQAFVNGQDTALKFRISGPAIVGTWGYGLEVELPKVRYTAMRAPLAPGRLAYDLSFEALVDASAAPFVEATCRIWNKQSDYL
jgi:hypothetical protein